MILHLSHGMTATCLLLCLASTAARAEEQKQASTEMPFCDICDLLSTPHDILSENFTKLSDKLDMFFSNTATYEELDKSYAELSINAVSQGYAMPNYYSDTRVFLEMPRTQKRLNLMFQLESNSEIDADNPDVTPGSPAQQTTALALRGDIQKEKNWRLYADVGSEYRGFIDPFLRFTYYQNFELGKWKLEWKEAIFRFGYRGNGITSGLRFDRPVTNKLHFRFTNQIIWYQTDDYYDRSHSLILYQDLQHRNALAYTLGYYNIQEPIDSVFYLQFKYKKLIHKTWLYYEIIPEVLYKESTLFSALPRLTIKLDIMLGNA